MKPIFKTWFKRKPEFYPKQIFAGHHGACNLILFVGNGDREPLLKKIDTGEIIESYLARKYFELNLPRIENFNQMRSIPGVYILETASTGGPLNRIRLTRMDVQQVETHE